MGARTRVLLLAGLLLATATQAAESPGAAADLYLEHCLGCHGEGRLGGMGPALLPDQMTLTPTANQGIRLSSSNPRRRFDVNQVQRFGGADGWRGAKVEAVRPGEKGLDLRSTGHLRAVEIVTRGSTHDVRGSLSRFEAGRLTGNEVMDLRISRVRPARLVLPR